MDQIGGPSLQAFATLLGPGKVSQLTFPATVHDVADFSTS